MYADINLVIKEEKSKTSKEQIRTIREVSFAILLFVALSSIMVFLINLRFSISSIKREENKAIEQLSLNNQSAAKIFILNSRLSDVNYILKNRKNYPSALNEIIETVSGTIVVNKLTLDQKTAQITLSSSNLSDFNIFLNSVLSSYPKKDISQIILKSLTDDESGFTMELEVNLK